jgi:hypothetical protein
MARTKKVSGSVEANIDETIQATIKEKYRKRAVERIHDEMKRLSEKQGRPFRNIDLARELGVDGSLITKWFKNDAEIKDYQLGAMADLFHCAKSWIDGSGNARVHESYNSVIEKTGLSEKAIEVLISKKEMLPEEGIDSFTDIVNYLITEGSAFIESIEDYRVCLALARDAREKFVEPYSFDEETILEALELYSGSMIIDPTIGLDVFGSFLNRTTAGAVLCGEKPRGRQLTNKEIASLYEYCKRINYVNIQAVKFGCSEQLIKLLSAIESSET